MKTYLEKIYLQYNEIKARLMDEESEKIFDARVEYAITRDWENIKKDFLNTKKWRCEELEKFLEKFSEKKDIVLFGAGKIGIQTKECLELCGYVPICFCDNYIDEEVKEGIPVISVEDYIKNYQDSIIIICSTQYLNEMYQQLLEKGCQKENILLPGGNRIQIQCGREYFDLFNPKPEEIFIDAGSFDGSTMVDFFSWLGEGEGKGYALEPVPELYDRIIERSRKENWKNVTVCNCAAWDKEETICLIEDKKENGIIWGGSSVCNSGEMKVDGKSIDNLCAEEEQITFIKMDIEGSELKALKGARNIIRKQKPRLAISIYHKPLDVFEIPSYILSLVPEYKLYIRHYTSDSTETVLYAEV